MPVFVDTNILLYAVSSAKQEQAKTETARGILEAGDFRLSVQVLQEFYVNAVGKLARPLSRANALNFIQKLCETEPLPTDTTVMLRGIRVSRRFQISYWDGAIVAAAQLMGCGTLLTEDLNHGQSYDNVRVLNPFIEA